MASGAPKSNTGPLDRECCVETIELDWLRPLAILWCSFGWYIQAMVACLGRNGCQARFAGVSGVGGVPFSALAFSNLQPRAMFSFFRTNLAVDWRVDLEVLACIRRRLRRIVART